MTLNSLLYLFNTLVAIGCHCIFDLFRTTENESQARICSEMEEKQAVTYVAGCLFHYCIFAIHLITKKKINYQPFVSVYLVAQLLLPYHNYLYGSSYADTSYFFNHADVLILSADISASILPSPSLIPVYSASIFFHSYFFITISTQVFLSSVSLHLSLLTSSLLPPQSSIQTYSIFSLH